MNVLTQPAAKGFDRTPKGEQSGFQLKTTDVPFWVLVLGPIRKDKAYTSNERQQLVKRVGIPESLARHILKEEMVPGGEGYVYQHQRIVHYLRGN